MTDTPNVVSMRGIVKRFPGVLANDQADFDLRRGEIHALLGENGAGKSTLMNILAGLYRPDAGTILVHDQPAVFASPRQAIQAGIGMIHQHFMLVPSQSVAENVLLGMDQPRFRLNLTQYERTIAELGQRYGLPVDPRAKIWQLSVGEQQRVEILKMLYRGADVLILDEPTSALGVRQTALVLNYMLQLCERGIAIIFITHNARQAYAVGTRFTVLNRGRTVGTFVPTEKSREELEDLMSGTRELVGMLKTATTG